MSIIHISNVAGRVPTVNQLLTAETGMGYNRADGLFYALRVLGSFKTVVAINGTSPPVTIPVGEFKGTAVLTTNPGTPTADEWWTATEVGTYTNFGGVVVTTMTDVFNYLKWTQSTSSWSVQTVSVPNPAIIDDISFEFRDITPGTSQTYDLDIKASFPYTIESASFETDNGTLTGVAVKIGSTAVTSLSSVTVDTAVDETASTGAKTVVVGNRVTLVTSTGYTGTPTLIRGKLKIRRT